MFSNLTNAQNVETKSLEYIYELLKNKCDIPNKSESFYCDKINQSLKVKYNVEGKIHHLGIALFNDDFINYFGETICNFHERLFLELCLLPDIEINKHCKEHNLFLSVEKLTGNNILAKKDIEKTINFIREDNTRYILVKDSLYCSSTWENDTKKIELFFPSTFSLISGMDKKEADDLFEKELKNLTFPGYATEVLLVEKQDLHPIRKDVLVKYGKTIFIKEMTSNLYFTHKKGEGYSLIYDQKYPVESLSNMIIYPDKNTQKLSVKVKHNAYGGEIKEYNANFFDFLMFLDCDYNTYIGIEKATKESLNFTIIFQNKYYNCHHLLYIETSPDIIFNGEKHLTGTLYTYIPNHNIKDLHKKYVNNKNQ